jgi:Nucleotidyl transferase AbiEii toxin, Type IV TA system
MFPTELRYRNSETALLRHFKLPASILIEKGRLPEVATDILCVTYAMKGSLSTLLKVEVTLDSPKLPTVSLPGGSLVALLKKRRPEVVSITCLDYVENAADKLSAAIWRIASRVRGSKDDDPTLIRHIYDLAMLKDSVIGRSGFADLVRATMDADSGRTKGDDFSILSNAEKGNKLIAILENDHLYAEEYQRFVAGLSYAPSDRTPDFAKALEALRMLVASIA